MKTVIDLTANEIERIVLDHLAEEGKIKKDGIYMGPSPTTYFGWNENHSCVITQTFGEPETVVRPTFGEE